jgi:hypothetical protein
MFNSQLLPLLLAISFSIAAPADSAAPTVRLEPLLNLTEASVHAIRSTGITDPAATFNAFTTTDCDGTIYSISPRDGECWAMININSIDIQEFFGSCYASKFTYTSLRGNLRNTEQVLGNQALLI